MTPDDAGGSSGEARLTGVRILYAVSAMGLGHVQRTLPLIRHLIREGAELEIVSHGRALEALKRELEEDPGPSPSSPDLTYHELTDYPPLQRGRGVAHYLYYLRDLVAIRRRTREEEAFLAELHRTAPLDAVIADGRFGFVHPGLPCFLISHQLKVLLPRYFRPFQWLSDQIQIHLLRRYDRVFVHDLADPAHSLAGELAHNSIARKVGVEYIGPLSTLADPPPEREAEGPDILFVTGGFIEAERRRLIRRVGEMVERLPTLRVTFLLGGGDWDASQFPEGVELRPLALGRDRKALMKGAGLWVGRTGQTTLMDVWAAGAPAVLVPTPGMTEQAYLARMVSAWAHDPRETTHPELVDAMLKGLDGAVFVDGGQMPATLRRWTPAHSVAAFHSAFLDALNSAPEGSRQLE